MTLNKELYDFFMSQSWQLSEDWYAMVVDKDPSSVYSTENPEIIAELKKQNQEYFLHFYKLFTEDETHLHGEFRKWSQDLADDLKHLDTPLHFIIREYMNSQKVALKYINKFIELNEERVSLKQALSWYETTINAFNLSIAIFVESYHKNTMIRLISQKDLINELSSPVIKLQGNSALLPLIGDIDTARAKIILENTLVQCVEQSVSSLCIDLSGVAIMDTMVANELFNLIKALKLIGVRTTLSGIRPEIAQTAVLIGLKFEDVSILPSLSQALDAVKEI
ncbi:RsbT co-antagonist protein RsbRB [Neobacillus piezotolerans]|uniref:RsbT co-antagonist protein RsbRB n=1 Tax=Neobacillus piezotolerans TaxID=2259171 RepID=A0A3D8GMQ0_9BACI|nr:STAS domain-containing protein [Neobacillus piezotolerans]RDU35733.1 RsbT co-antagonist protein RsbRB [Neobacillus piezotolerans]